MIKVKKDIFRVNYVTIMISFVLLMLIAQTSYHFDFMTTISPVVRGIERQVISLRVENYEILETDHFTIRYKNTNKSILALIAKIAEDKYSKAVYIFQYKPDGKILLIIHDDPGEMKSITTLGQEASPMGVYYGDSIHILDPSQWVKNAEDIEQMERTLNSEGPILHELVHLIVDHMAKGNFPMWFTEGVSLYFEYLIDGYEWGKEVDFTRDDYTIEELTYNFNKLDQYRSYTKAFRLVKAYVDTNGVSELIEVIKCLGQGKKFDELTNSFFIR